MKRLNLICLLAALLLTTGLMAGPEEDKEPQASKPALYLAVTVPPMWDSTHEAEIADAFHQRVAEKLRKAGFIGEIAGANRFDDISEGIPVIEINLMQWRPERTGNIVCTFSANLKRGVKGANLGLFTGTAPQWMTTASQTWELRRGLDDSADSAVASLIKRLRNEQFLPPANKSL